VVAHYTGIEHEEPGESFADPREPTVDPEKKESQSGRAELGGQEHARALLKEEAHDRVQLGAPSSDVRQGEHGVEDMEYEDHGEDGRQTPADLVDVNRLQIGRSAWASAPPAQQGVSAQGRRWAPSAIDPVPPSGVQGFCHSY
jgi:hypothetical protein